MGFLQTYSVWFSAQFYYLSAGHELELVTIERELGVRVSKESSWNEHLTLKFCSVESQPECLAFETELCAGIVLSKALNLLYACIVSTLTYVLLFSTEFGHLTQWSRIFCYLKASREGPLPICN